MEFTSWRSYWNFHHSVLNKGRYIRTEESEAFLNAVLETSAKREKVIEANTILWRAQLGHDYQPHFEGGQYVDDIPCPFDPDRMKPLKNEATEGRVNPKGMPYLYLASDKATAMGEVRGWIGSLISAGQFRLNCDLTVVDCRVNEEESFIYYFKEPDAQEREKLVWSDINRAFSHPITNTDKRADYAPTQILAELFKTNGFDAIVYTSSLGKGSNIAVFDVNKADLIMCSLFKVKNINYTFDECANPYFISKRKKDDKQ